jgi:hypothetical protein
MNQYGALIKDDDKIIPKFCTRKKSCPSATLFTTNPTSTALNTNSGLADEKPTSNHLIKGTA